MSKISERDIMQLMKIAMDSRDQGQLQIGETALLQALELAVQLDDLSLIIYVRSMLAWHQSSQWKYLEALDHCTWLIHLVSDPDYQERLSWDDKKAIKDGYNTFITCAQNLPNISDENILLILDEGIRWLERIGKDEWTNMLRFEKGNIHLKRGETRKAEDAYTKAQALFSRANAQEGVHLCQSQLVMLKMQTTGNYNVPSNLKAMYEELVGALSEDGTVTATLLNGFFSAYSYLSEGQIDRAYEVAQRNIIIATQMDNPDFLYFTYNMLSQILRADQQYQRAIDNISVFLQDVPDYAPALVDRGEIYSLADDQQKALDDMNLAITLDDQEGSYFAKRSNIYQETCHYQEALQDINHALTLEPQNATYFYQRSNYYRYVRQYPQALADTDYALQLEPQNALYHAHRGGIYREIRCYPKALEDTQRALELTPTLMLAFIEQAAMYRDSERYDEALHVLDRAIELEADNQYYYLHRGIIYRLQGNYQRARADITYNASSFSFQNLVWRRHKFMANVQNSIIYHYEENYQLALQEATQAIILKPSDATCYSQRGAVHYDMGQDQSALADLQQAAALDAYAPRILLQRAAAYRRLGQYQKALQDADRAVELDPEDHPGYAMRASIYWMLERYNEATTTIEQAIRLAQNDVRPLNGRIGLIMYNLFMQRIPDAQQHFDFFMHNCQSPYFLQHLLFLLRDFVHLKIEYATASIFCDRLQRRIAE